MICNQSSNAQNFAHNCLVHLQFQTFTQIKSTNGQLLPHEDTIYGHGHWRESEIQNENF